LPSHPLMKKGGALKVAGGDKNYLEIADNN
jgi:hypothetical protein